MTNPTDILKEKLADIDRMKPEKIESELRRKTVLLAAYDGALNALSDRQGLVALANEIPRRHQELQIAVGMVSDD